MTKLQKTHWFRNTLIVLIICGIVGTVLAGWQFLSHPDASVANATLQFSFEGSADGLAPNGNAFDVAELTSDAVLSDALETAGMSDKYTPEQLRTWLTVNGSYPEKMIEQASDTSSLLSGGSPELDILNYRPTVFTVSLSNGLDPSMTQADQKALLQNIMEAYTRFFAAHYSENMDLTETAYDLSGYDYPQMLDIVALSMTQKARFAEELYARKPSFKYQGKSFSDISTRLNNLIGSELARLNASVTMNALTKDTGRLLTQYQYEIESLNNQLAFQQERLEKLDKLIEAYNKNEVIYLSTAGSVTRIEGDANATYNKLVAARKTVTENITALNREVSVNLLRMADLAGGTAESEKSDSAEAAAPESEASADSAAEPAAGETQDTSALTAMTEEEIAAAAAAAQEAIARQTASLEKSIDALILRRDAVFADFQAMLKAYNDQEINENTLTVRYGRFYAPSLLSGAFIKKVLKTAGPFCAVGFMVCMVLLIRSRRKEEKSRG